jgi:hypothetical protein
MAILLALFLLVADPYAPLRLYDGTWIAIGGDKGAAPKTTRIANICRRVGAYFTCQQTVDGKLSNLIVFIPDGAHGHYYLQAVLPDGHATGRGELTIAGPLWSYLNHGDENGAAVLYRTTNHFTDNSHIHYEMSQSRDGGKTWITTGGGDEHRQE